MKFFGYFVFVLCIVALIDATPICKKNFKPKCDIACTADYTPVCGAIPNDNTFRPRLFGNKCALTVHNCENNSNLVVVDMARCEKVGGVRLY